MTPICRRSPFVHLGNGPERQAYGYEGREPPARRVVTRPRLMRRDLGGDVTATRPETIRLTDDSTKPEIAEALTHLAAYAARQQHHPDSVRWVRAHERIDRLLCDWERAEDA